MKFRKMKFMKRFFAVVMVFVFAMNIVTPAMAETKDKRVTNSSVKSATELGLADPTDTYTVTTASVSGGALENNGTITGTIGPSFKDNKAQSESGMAFAGAIYNSAIGTIESIKGSTFTSNSAVVDNTSGGETDVAGGGAIGNLGKITSITDATFANNSATACAGVMAGGGAIGNYMDSTIEDIVNSTFFRNYAKTTDDEDHKGQDAGGGAISNYGGTITTIKGSTFTENYIETTGTTNSGYAVGGAIYNGGGTITTIQGITFTKNYTKAGIGGSAVGGAIANYPLEISAGGILEGNIQSIMDSSFTENYAEAIQGGSEVALGGAIMNGSRIESITNSGFAGNEVTIKKTSGEGTMAAGGAIGNYEGTINSIAGSSFTGNKATASEGSAIAAGGAIGNYEGTINSIAGSSFTGNTVTATEAGGGACGGAIANAGESSTIGSITNTSFTGNTVAATTATETTAGANGGAIANLNGSIESIANSSFTGNTVTATGTTGEANASGGAIANGGDSGSIGNIENTSFTGNTVTAIGTTGEACGGAIANGDSGSIGNIANTSFTGNTVTATAMALGGAIVDENSEGSGITITNSSFAGNNATATGSEGVATGGALLIPIANITDSSFTGNMVTATGANGIALGGAILTLAGHIEAETKDVLFSGNKVSGTTPLGSAIYVGMPDPESTDDSPTLTLQAASGKKITFDNDQTIEGTSGYTVNITGSGTVVFKQDQATNFKNAGIYGANVSVSKGATLALYGSAGIFDTTDVEGSVVKSSVTLDDGALDFTDGAICDHTFSSLILSGDKGGSVKLDVDLAQEKMDTIRSQSISGSAELHITTLALLTDTAKNETKINFTTDEDLKSLTRYDKEGAEIRSHTFNYIAKYDNTTGDFTFTNAGVSETTKAVSDTANVMNFAWLQSINNLQKRLGDLRGGEESNLAWIRFQRSNDDFQGTRQSNISGNMYQVGYDFALGNDSAARGYFGVSLDRFDGTQSFKIGNGDIKSTTVSAYYTKVYNSGHYFDFIFRYGRYENDAKSYDAGITTQLDYAMNGVTLSGEYGYRANLGKGGLYLEPQAEFIYGYLAGAQKRSSTNYLADIDSTNHFVTRLGLALGQRVKNFNYYLRASYYHNFAGSTNIKYGDASYKQDSAKNWWEVSLGGGWNVSKISYFYAELTKHFKDVSNSLNFNLGFRISL